MLTVLTFADRTVAVFGLARSGRSAVRALLAGGARVAAWDDNEKARNAAADLPLADWRGLDWRNIAALVLSPGVPLTHPAPHPVVVRAREAGVPVIGDVELFLAARPRGTKLVGITGTNGKSTTTTLIGHILAGAGVPVAVGGNLGVPVLDLAELPEGGVYVLEMSSFQIDLTPSWHADVACLLNITPDHLDRHGNMETYVAVKRRLFNGQGAGDVAVLGVDDAWSSLMALALRQQKVVTVSVVGGGGIFVKDGILLVAGEPLADLRDLPTLRGAHNWQNAAVAFAALRALGVPADTVLAGLRSFPGLAHRMEQVGRVGDIIFINDSKATNADAAAKALGSFDGIHWIAGGKPKEGGIEGLDEFHPRIRKAYLIGVAEAEFAATLDGKVAVARCGTLDRALDAAFADARAAGNGTVLLSPACASYDQFKDFEQRGDTFRTLVHGLIAAQAQGAAA